MRYRYFDPLQQATIEGEIDDVRVTDLVDTVQALRATCPPAIEFTGADGSSLVLGVAADRGVLLWTDTAGTTSHSVGEPDAAGAGIVFDYFGAYTELPARYAVPLPDAVASVERYASEGSAPAVPMLVN